MPSKFWIVSSLDQRSYGASPGGVPRRVFLQASDFDVELILRVAREDHAHHDHLGDLNVWTGVQADATMFSDAATAVALALVFESVGATVHEVRLVVHDGGTHA